MKSISVALALYLIVSVSLTVPSLAQDPGAYYPGVAWVKVKRKHRELFSAPDGRLAFGVRAATPLIPALPRNANAARASATGTDRSLYFELHQHPDGSPGAFIAQLKATGYFDVVEPVRADIQPMFSPNDPQRIQQYYLDIIDAFDAWDIARGDALQVIAIVDTGGDMDHPDLRENLFIDPDEPIDGIDNDGDGYIDNNRGWDFSGSDTELITPDFQGDNDPSVSSGGLLGHGTEVAGCAAATPNNGIGIAGIGYHTKLMFTKHVSDHAAPSETSFSSSPYKGIIYAATHGAKIINCSWGSAGTPSVIEQDIIRYVTLDLGCLVVAAAGNSNSTAPIYPASYDLVMSVAASNSSDLKHGNSSYGYTVDIIAPGAGMLTTAFNDSYTIDQGTSLSSPLVAGAAALVWEKNPTYTPLQVAEQLRVTADESFYTNNAAYQLLLGKGRLNVAKALTMNSPAIRVTNLRWNDANGKPLTPGSNGSLSFDIVNFLQPTTSLSITATSLSPYATIGAETLVFGAVPTLDTLDGSANAFPISFTADAPPEQGIDVLLRFTDGDYYDFQVITLAYPTLQHITENNITTSLIANGRVGFSNPSTQSDGYGFQYRGQQLLNELGLLAGTSASDLADNVRIVPGVYDDDLSVVDPPLKRTPGLRSSSEVSGEITNRVGTLGLSYQSLVWNSEPESHYNDFVILEYTLENLSGRELDGLYFGIFADWDISALGTNDKALWDGDHRLGYVTSPGLPYAGVQLLRGKVNYYAIDNANIDVGYSRASKFIHLSSGIGNEQAGLPNGTNVSHVLASGPHTLAAGEKITLAFALHGADDLPALTTSAQYADSLYNYTLQASVPVIDTVQSCIGATATVQPQGASTFNWYTQFTGGVPVATGATFSFSALQHDTILYVSNAEHPYESVRAKALVQANANPVASFDYRIGTDTEVAFEDHSIHATSWHWDFGDGNTSEEENPTYTFASGGNFSVMLKVQSDNGCTDEQTASFLITGIPEENGSAAVSIYPNPVSGNRLTLQCQQTPGANDRISVHDSKGAALYEVPVMSSVNEIDLTSFPPAIYLVRYRHGVKSTWFKVVRK